MECYRGTKRAIASAERTAVARITGGEQNGHRTRFSFGRRRENGPMYAADGCYTARALDRNP